MRKEVGQPGVENFLSFLMLNAWIFEAERQSVDGTMRDLNTPEYVLTRGVIGEAEECLAEVEEGNIEAAKMEAVDIMMFVASLFDHLGMTPEEVVELAWKKVDRNQRKYHPRNFQGVTLEEGIQTSIRTWKMRTEGVAAD